MQSSSRIIVGDRLVRTIVGQSNKFLGQRVVSFANTTGRTADPADHSIEPEEVNPTDAIKDAQERHHGSAGDSYEPTTKDNEPYVSPDPTILRSAAKVESNAVGPRTEPLTQQKRRVSSTLNAKEVSCAAGIEVSPWKEEEKKEPTRREQREEDERDDREYFKHHKASPLSEIEISDSRKPITQASDSGDGGGGLVMFRPEQMDTAEDSLYRAAEMFRRNAMRGDPDSPHGSWVLRQLRGEYW